MKFVLLLTLICALVAATTAAVGSVSYKDPKHPGKCVVGKQILSSGEEANDSESCARMLCGDDGIVTFQSCGTIIAPPGHKLGDSINPNAPYPDCCLKEVIPIA